MGIVIRINHWAIHLMLFKGPVKYASNLHFRMSVKVFIENCAVSSGLGKKVLSGAINQTTPKTERGTKDALIMKE